MTDAQIRASFVNATAGEVRRLTVPDLASVPWTDLDFLGWVDPRAPRQAALVAPTTDGPVGLLLRRNEARAGRRAKMCSLCLTVHPASGVALMVAARAGRAGREGNTRGLDVCADLACSAYVRGLKVLPAMSRIEETTSTLERVARLRRNLDAFVSRVCQDS